MSSDVAERINHGNLASPIGARTQAHDGKRAMGGEGGIPTHPFSWQIP
jgi:hypothetical protein